MVKSCSAFGCTKRFEKGSGVTFHSFPSKPEIREQWEEALGRKNWKAGKSSCICSVHFEEEWFDRTGQTVRLRRDAIPSVFEDPYLQAGNQEKLMEESAPEPPPAFQRKPGLRNARTKGKKFVPKLRSKKGMKGSSQNKMVETKIESIRYKRKVQTLEEVIVELKRKKLAKQEHRGQSKVFQDNTH